MEDNLPSQGQQRAEYFQFLSDFREYFVEYIRESVVETQIAEVVINGQVELFKGFPQGKATIKNQGDVTCYVSTKVMGGYRLDPGEKVEFWVNSPVNVTTVSGSTSVGFIKY